jgi:hypothetical protein
MYCCTVTSFDLPHPLTSLVCNAVSSGIGASTWEFREDTYIVSTTHSDLKSLLRPVLEDYLGRLLHSSAQHFFFMVF